MGADLDGSASVMDEGRFGWAPGYDTSGDFKHLPPRARKQAKARQIARRQRWSKAESIRKTWTEEQLRQEQERLDREKEDILASRRAA